jgi:hypothetical protein
MDGLAWGAVLGFLSTVLVAAVAFYGHRVYRSIESSKVKVAESEASVDAQRIKLEGWADIVTSLQTERAELNKIIDRKDAIIAARDETIDKLQTRLYDYPRTRRTEPEPPT